MRDDIDEMRLKYGFPDTLLSTHGTCEQGSEQAANQPASHPQLTGLVDTSQKMHSHQSSPLIILHPSTHGPAHKSQLVWSDGSCLCHLSHHPLGQSSMTVTVTMTIPLRASRANLDSCQSISLTVYPLAAHPHPHPYPHPSLCRVQRPDAVGSDSRSFILTSCFCLCVGGFFLLWLHVTSLIAHNGMAQTNAPQPPPLLSPFNSGPFVFLFPGILAYPRVHRPPKSREACKDHGASEWRALVDWIKEYPHLRPRLAGE